MTKRNLLIILAFASRETVSTASNGGTVGSGGVGNYTEIKLYGFDRMFRDASSYMEATAGNGRKGSGANRNLQIGGSKAAARGDKERRHRNFVQGKRSGRKTLGIKRR